MDIRDLPNNLFAPIRRHSALVRVYIASREERYEGAAFILRGKQRVPIDIPTLLKKYRSLNGKAIRAFTLVGGKTYMFRSPAGGDGRVFIVPKSGNRRLTLDGHSLKPMTCVVFSDKEIETMPYVLFRAQYRMLPNAVSSRSENTPKVRHSRKRDSPPTRPAALTRPAPVAVPAQQISKPQSLVAEYTPLARLVRDGKPMGLQLRNSAGQINRVNMEKCVAWARDGRIAGVKAVTRNGVSFVAGVGRSLETLPAMDV